MNVVGARSRTFAILSAIPLACFEAPLVHGSDFSRRPCTNGDSFDRLLQAKGRGGACVSEVVRMAL